MGLIKTTATLKIKDNVRRDTFSRRICCPKLIGRIINNEISTRCGYWQAIFDKRKNRESSAINIEHRAQIIALITHHYWVDGSFIVLILPEHSISITPPVSPATRHNKSVKLAVIHRIACGSRCRGDNDPWCQFAYWASRTHNNNRVIFSRCCTCRSVNPHITHTTLISKVCFTDRVNVVQEASLIGYISAVLVFLQTFLSIVIGWF